ncbi:unnamed protein product [Danaus chrysippus]|uniref:(African queen) hypothetical protein n=1 Tax=Danaus chrysippus TaxID=151541 RepID=A0A8J2VR76_9NEOP|nr:unnamed protein product [Danaus chrysippus]
MLLCLIVLCLLKHDLTVAKVITLKTIEFISNANPTRLSIHKQSEKDQNDLYPEENILGRDAENKVTDIENNTLDRNKVHTEKNVTVSNEKGNSVLSKDDITSYKVPEIYLSKKDNHFDHVKRYVPISEDIKVPGFLEQDLNRKIFKDGLRLLPFL